MRLLVLGGTAWLGSAIVATALADGHDVTCLTRGSGIPDGATAVIADRDEPDALARVVDRSSGAREWDAVLDVARQPGHVRRAARALEPVARHYLFVSSCSVYATQALVGGDENVPTFEPLEADIMASPDEYGAAKVACERGVLETFGDGRSLIARAGLIGGPGDPTGRSTYWPWRFAHPSNPEGTALVPDAPDLPTALIDVRDLARWLVDSAANGTSGIFNAMGHPHPLPAHLSVARAVAGHTGPVAAAVEPWLAEHEVAEWSGPRSMPLWLADPDWYGMNARSIERALAAGLRLRPLEDTLRDILSSQLTTPSGAGLTDDDERELLAALATE